MSGDAQWTPRSPAHLPRSDEWRGHAATLLARVGDEETGMPSECLSDLLRALEGSPSPERALVGLDRLVSRVSDVAGLFRRLSSEPRLTDILVGLLTGSDYLTDLLVRDPRELDHLLAIEADPWPPSESVYACSAREALRGTEDYASRCDALRRVQIRELLRIGARDLLGLADLTAVTRALALLADALVQSSLQAAADRIARSAAGFCVLALGKLGGQELNYSSDIDLLYVAREDPAAYVRLGEGVIDALSRNLGEGAMYRVDMRLRPWGQVGPLVSSVEAYLAYLGAHARLWERQALLKARPIAGDFDVGWDLLHRATPLLYSVDCRAARRDIREMRRRTEAQLRRRGAEWGEIKHGRGSIRDVEFITQYLQLVHGADVPQVRSGNNTGRLAGAESAGPDPRARLSHIG